MTEPLLIERRDDVETWTLNQPETMNAISDDAMIDAFVANADPVNRDGKVRAVIITGAGRAFSSGGNVKQMPVVHLREKATGRTFYVINVHNPASIAKYGGDHSRWRAKAIAIEDARLATRLPASAVQRPQCVERRRLVMDAELARSAPALVRDLATQAGM